MGKRIDEIIAKLPKSRQKKILAKASELIAVEMTLQELRKNRKLSQKRISKILGIGQDNVSRLEHRPDIRLSTLHNYIQALGGSLRIIADFPGSPSIQLAGLSSERE